MVSNSRDDPKDFDLKPQEDEYILMEFAMGKC